MATGTLAVSTKIIGGQSIKILATLADLDEATLKGAAKMAIDRLKTMSGPLPVKILSFSHTVVLAKIDGKELDTGQQKRHLLTEIAAGNTPSREPAAVGLELKEPLCFVPPIGMNVYKLNIAGTGAKSCMSSQANIANMISEDNYFLKIYRSVISITTTIDVAATAAAIFTSVETVMGSLLLSDAKAWVDAYSTPRFDSIQRITSSRMHPYRNNRNKKISAAAAAVAAAAAAAGTITFNKLSKKAQADIITNTSYKGLVEAATYSFHYKNLTREPRQAFKTHKIQTGQGTCMLNKEFLRHDGNPVEHYPALDWNVIVVDDNGIIIGNVLDPNSANFRSTQIPDDMHAAIMQGIPSDSQTQQIWMASWMMDLITLIKISKGVNTVTTSIILNFLSDNGIQNVIFIDGGCNVFYDDDKGTMIACGPCDPAVSVPCANCTTIMQNHAYGGGMKNKKIKTTKNKKARNVRTVRGLMRKSSKRNKRSKTYKTYKR